MRASITTELIRRLPLANVDVRDTKLPGFLIRCRPSGRHSYLVQLGRGRMFTLGLVSVLTIEEARTQARIALGDQAKGADPIAARRKKRGLTLKAFVAEVYGPWQVANRKTGEETIKRIGVAFKAFLPLKLADITPWHVEKWRTERQKASLSPATINRDVTALKSALNRAVDWGLLDMQPLHRVKPLPVDSRGVARYLSAAEELQLRDALAARDVARRAERERANTWRRERGYPEWPPHSHYTDHLRPLVLLALNTGLRRGELFQMRWRDVDVLGSVLTVRGAFAKNAQTRHVPLNSEALEVLRLWRTSCEDAEMEIKSEGFVFPSPLEADEPLEDIKKSWSQVVAAARLERFRFHDCRHHFASRLVQLGVDLNTVRELLGHSDIKMVLRYAHLAPENTAAAVAKLVAAR